MFNVFSKIVLFVVYGFVLVSYVMLLLLLVDVIGWLCIVVLVLLVVYLLEVVLCFCKVVLYNGLLFDSVLLMLLFGFLYWKFLVDVV